MKKENLTKIGVLLVIVAVFAVLYINFSEYLSLEYVKSKQAEFKEYYEANRLLVLSGYFVFYVVATAISLPGALILTLLAGALFGVVTGVILVSFASSLGATLAFLAARFILGDSLQKKYADSLKKMNDGIEREGAFYLFTLRLIPLFPFFLINLLMGLTRIRVWTYYWVTQVGAFAGTVVYVYAGTTLSEIDSLGGILSLELALAFAAIGILPLLSKKLIEFLRRRRAGAGS